MTSDTGSGRRDCSCTCGGRRCHVWHAVHRVLASDNWPVIADFVEDKVTRVPACAQWLTSSPPPPPPPALRGNPVQVRSRTMTVALLLVVVLFVMRVGLYTLFLWNPIVAVMPPEVILTPLDGARAPSEIGRALSPAVNARVTALDGSGGVNNVTATLSFAVDEAATQVWQLRWGYADTWYDWTGLPVNDRFDLPGFVPRALLTPRASGTQVLTDTQGYARWPAVTLEVGLPGRYTAMVTVPPGSSATVGKVDFTSRVARIVPINVAVSRDNTTIALGQRLPQLSVQVVDARGAPIPGKRVVLISAPPTRTEFTSLLVRPDVLLPRFAAFDPSTTVSSLTDFLGIATFTNVTITASTLRTVIAELVCDGVRSVGFPVTFSVAPFADAALTNTSGFATPTDVRLTIVRQPDATVLEGTPMLQPPVVLVERRLASGGWTPLTGVRLIALPMKQAGMVSETLVYPHTVRELNLVGGTAEAVLANVGSAKLLFNGTSAATNATGHAAWPDPMGFIRHGPAGVYSLTFGLAGIVAATVTRDIVVTSSVANVTWAPGAPQPPALVNVTVHSFPTRRSVVRCSHAPFSSSHAIHCAPPHRSCCRFDIGAPYGSPVYAAYADVVFGPGAPVSLPDGPSGFLPFVTTLRITDAAGRVLAGKTSQVELVSTVVGGAPPSPALRVREFPFPGAAASSLSLATEAEVATDDGALVYQPHQGGLGATAVAERAASTGNPPAYWRFVTAPAGTRQGIGMRWVVEGAPSPVLPVSVTNIDNPAVAGTLCGHLEFTSTPTSLSQVNYVTAGASGTPFPSPITVAVMNTFGEPVAASNVQLFATDSVGVLALRGSSGVVTTVRQDDLNYLLTMGGASGMLMEGLATQAMGVTLLPAVSNASVASDGHAAFALSGLLISQLTYVRYAAVAQTAGPPVTNPTLPRQGGCVSTYTPAIMVTGSVASVRWTGPATTPGAITCVSDGATPFTPTPTAEIIMKDGTVARGADAFAVLVSVVDEPLRSFPAHLAVQTRRFEVTSSSFFGYTTTRAAGDVGSSVLLPSYSDHILYGSLNPFVTPVLASMAHHLRTPAFPGGPFVPLDAGDIYLIRPSDAAFTTGPPLFPNVTQAIGLPGTFRFSLLSQGVLAEPTAAITCTDRVNVLLPVDYSSTTCPTNMELSFVNPLTGVFTQNVQSAPTSTCANSCGTTLRGSCVCGVCFCRGGWDGDASCTTPFDGDGFNTLFSNDPQYAL